MKFVLFLIIGILSLGMLVVSFEKFHSELLGNLSLGLFFICFGAMFIEGTRQNYKKIGVAFTYGPFREKAIYKGSKKYRNTIILFIFVGICLFILGMSFVVAELCFNYHILKES